jgi:hypothetical protein
LFWQPENLLVRSVARLLPRIGRDAGWWCALRVVSHCQLATCVA